MHNRIRLPYIILSFVVGTLLGTAAIFTQSGQGVAGELYQQLSSPVRSFQDFVLPDNSTPKPSLQVSAWIPEWDWENGVLAFAQNADAFAQINPIWYVIDQRGKLEETEYVGNIQLADIAREHNVLLVPTIQSFDPEYLHNAIGSEEKARAHADEILRIVDRFDLDGIDLDYEAIYLDDKELYFAMLNRLRSELDRRGKLLVVDVIAKTSDDPDTYDSLIETRQVQDWSRLAEYADTIRIMAYDYKLDEPFGAPINPYYWLENIANYAITKADPGKFVLATPLYAYSYSDGELYRSYTHDVVAAGIRRRGATPTFDQLAREWRVVLEEDEQSTGSGTQTVWFQDAESFRHRVELMKQYGFAGLALWRLGGEDTRIYELIE